MSRWTCLLVWSCLLAAAPAQEPDPGDEIGQHVANLKRQSEDASRPIGQRATVLMGAVETLDRAAHRAATLDEKLARWTQAIALLDGFNAANAGQPRAAEFGLQAAVYRWAQGQSGRDAAASNPADARLRERSIEALDDAIARLRSVPKDHLEKAVADNLRFRLARALADRAELEPAGSAGNTTRDAEALETMKEPVTAPGLKGFAGLLRADLLRRAGRLDEALKELAAATKAEPSPPDREVYETLVPILIEQGRFAEAEAAVERSRQETRAKDRQRFEVALARAARTAPGDARLAAERELFRQADALRKQPDPEARRALLDLAGSRIEPDARLDPLAWDVLGEALALRGDPEKAAAQYQRAARRAEELGRPEAAAAHRLRAGGSLFQAGKYAEADPVLSQVAADPKAGPARARAGMVRALARGRALSAGTPGVTAESYARALQDQVRDFPADPATAEARWLLGSLLVTSNETARALALWADIPPGSPRWLDAQLARFDVSRRTLESELFVRDRPELIADFKKIQDALAADLAAARSDAERTGLGLAAARLSLTPVVGQPARALDECDRLAGRDLTPPQRYRLRLLRMIALIYLGPPFLEAEREAQAHATWADPEARGTLLEAIRLLDLAAAFSDADLRQRRFGLVLRMLVQPALLDGDDSRWTPALRSELKLRLARACLFLGDERGAREALRNWTGPPPGAGDDYLRDVADTFTRLEAHELAIDVQRMRSKDLPAGSPAWFEARYGLALAYFHAGRLEDAAQLIDATAILHPHLGGGSVEKKFIRLRQRLGPRP